MFDGWFANSATFDHQKSAGLITCPVCGAEEVEKALMAPTVTGTKKQGLVIEHDEPSPKDGGQVIAPAPTHPVALDIGPEVLPTTIPEPLLHGDDTMRAVVEKMRELRSWVEDNAVNVGDKFAEKAREIHYGDDEPKGIYGKATFEEAQELIDEGVDFMPLPALPEDNN